MIDNSGGTIGEDAPERLLIRHADRRPERRIELETATTTRNTAGYNVYRYASTNGPGADRHFDLQSDRPSLWCDDDQLRWTWGR